MAVAVDRARMPRADDFGAKRVRIDRCIRSYAARDVSLGYVSIGHTPDTYAVFS